MEHIERKELIAFYNVENLFSPDPAPLHKLDPTNSGLKNWDVKRYQNKLFKISHVFELMREQEEVLPMLIGLSEVQGQTPLEELVKLPPFNSDFGVVHYDSLDERGVDVALLYDKNKIEILSSEPITFFFEIEDDNPANYDTTRDILHCRVKCYEQIINVFVLHLPSKREKDINKPKRKFILNEVQKKVSDLLQNSNEEILICGDFNENPDDEIVNNMLYNSDSDKILQNPSFELFKNKRYSTFYYKNGLLFDQMILSNKFFKDDSTFKFNGSFVFNHQKLANWTGKMTGRPFRTYAGSRYLGGYSDHFPVFIEFKISI